jgi:hypothetical protein
MAGKKQRLREERAALQEIARPDPSEGLERVKTQIRAAAKIAIGAVVVIWILAIAFWSGLDSAIPLWIALSTTLALGAAAFLVRRNLKKSEEFGALVRSGDGVSEEERKAQLQKLEAQVEKGDATAIMAKAQLLMQESPRDALATLEKVNLEKAQKLVAAEVRVMRAMIHLNLGEVQDARKLADDVDLSKIPDLRTRANLSAVVAEAWARSGNPIEGGELLDKYDLADPEFKDARLQLLRARVFACAHKQDLTGMRRALKALVEISPQLLGMFVGQKRIHPLLEKEARKMLEKAGFGPRPRVQFQRR